jgi:hypothetical protein
MRPPHAARSFAVAALSAGLNLHSLRPITAGMAKKSEPPPKLTTPVALGA